MQSRIIVKFAATSLALAVCFSTAQGWAGAKEPFHSKTGDVNTLDPAVNNFQEGLKKMKAADLDGAIDAFLQATYFARNNYHPAAFYFLGLCYKLQGKDTKGIDAFKTHIQQNVGPAPEAHVELGEIYMKLGRDQEAEREFNTALGEYRGPGPRAHNAMGKLLEKRGDLRNAQWHFLQALGDQPWMYTEAWMNLAENAMKQEEWSEAVEQFTGILVRGKTLPLVDYAKVHLDVGVCLMAKGDHHGAMDNWQQACELNPLLASPHLYLAKMFDQENHITSAIHEYRAYIRVAPPNETATIAKAKDRLAYLEQKVKPVEAEVQRAKPSPYMRQAAQKELEAKQQQQDRLRQKFEDLGGGGGPSKPESGF